MRAKNGLRAKNFKFTMVRGIKPGDEIEFSHTGIIEHTYKATVAPDMKRVIFEGKDWALSTVTLEILTRHNLTQPTKKYQGARYWKWHGMFLRDLREEM